MKHFKNWDNYNALTSKTFRTTKHFKKQKPNNDIENTKQKAGIVSQRNYESLTQ